MQSCGVTVAQVILVHFVEVRILTGLPFFFAHLKLLSSKRIFHPVRQAIGAHLGHKWVTIAGLQGYHKMPYMGSIRYFAHICF